MVPRSHFNYSDLPLPDRVKQLRQIFNVHASDRIRAVQTRENCPECRRTVVIEEIIGPYMREQRIECPHCFAYLGLSQAYELVVRAAQPD